MRKRRTKRDQGEHVVEPFLKSRTPEQIEADSETFAQQDPRTEKQKAVDAANAELLFREATDQEAARILALARLLFPNAWTSRDDLLRMAQRERSGRRGNDPSGRRLVAAYERSALSQIAYPIRKAQEAIALMKGWS